jgi:hypothetical protein
MFLFIIYIVEQLNRCYDLTYLLKKFVNNPCSKAKTHITTAIFIKSFLLGTSSFVSLLLNLPIL